MRFMFGQRSYSTMSMNRVRRNGLAIPEGSYQAVTAPNNSFEPELRGKLKMNKK